MSLAFGAPHCQISTKYCGYQFAEEKWEKDFPLFDKFWQKLCRLRYTHRCRPFQPSYFRVHLSYAPHKFAFSYMSLRTNQHLWMLFQMKCWSWEVWCWATSSYICQVRSTCYCYLSCTCCTLWFCVRPFYRPLTNFHNRSSRKFDHLMLFESILKDRHESHWCLTYIYTDYLARSSCKVRSCVRVSF